jgi:hypothetical protein
MDNNFIPLQSLASGLAQQTQNLLNGDNGRDALEKMVSDSRELYERLLVLRHKAFELELNSKINNTQEPIAFSLDTDVDPIPDLVFNSDEAIRQVNLLEMIDEVEADAADINNPVSLTVEQESVEPNDASVFIMDLDQDDLTADEMDATDPIDSPISHSFSATSLNELIASQQAIQNNSIGKKLEKGPIEDLKKSITLNQRFQFARELFNGDNQEYEIVIEKLNSIHRDDALKQLESLQSKHNWRQDSVAYMEFFELIQRRHAL